MLIVAKFVPTTVPGYSTLKGTTTVHTTTTSNGVPVPFVWVIGPGGLAFGKSSLQLSKTVWLNTLPQHRLEAYRYHQE